MAAVHQSVNEMSKTYLTNDRRYNYTTPKTFLGLIDLYSKLLSNTNCELQQKIERLQIGLEKLKITSKQVIVINFNSILPLYIVVLYI